MRTRALVILLVGLATVCFAQPPDTLWTRALGGADPGSREAWGICGSNDGSFWVAGFDQLGGQTASAVIYRIGLMGDMLDTVRMSDGDFHALYSVAPTADGGCIAAGKTTFTAGGTALLLIKVSAAGSQEWTRSFTDDPTRVGLSVQQCADGGYIVTGRSRDAAQRMRAFLVKTDTAGTMQWSRIYGTDTNDQGFSVQQTTDGGYVLTGTTDVQAAGVNSVLVIRTDAPGNQIWRQSYSLGGYDEGHAIRAALDGGYVIAGWTRVLNTFNNDMLIAKIATDGTLQWNHHYGQSAVDIAWDMETTQDGGYVLAGYTRSSVSSAMLLKTDANGDSMWARTFPAARDGEFKAVAVSPDGGIAAAGYRYITATSSNFYVVRLAVPSGVGGIIHDGDNQPVAGAMVAAVGQPYWTISDPQGHYTLSLLPGTYDIITYGRCTGRDTVRNITVLEDSIAALDLSVGYTDGVVEQTSLNPVVHNRVATPDTLYLRNDGAGVLDFSVVCSSIRPSYTWLAAEPTHATIPADSLWKVIIWVSSDTTDDGVYDFYGVVDVHMNTCPDSVRHLPVIASVLDAKKPGNIPHSFGLSVSPNPFNPATMLNFDLPRAEQITLSVYDVMGRQVASMVSGMLEAGAHRIAFDGQALPSGLYFARLQTPTHSFTQKLLLLK